MGVKDKIINKELDQLYHQYAKIITGTGLVDRFFKHIIIWEIKKLEKKEQKKMEE